jgi:hypothetical protein
MSAPGLPTHRAASVDAMAWVREHRGTEAQRQPAEDERAVLRGLPERRRGQLLELVDEHDERRPSVIYRPRSSSFERADIESGVIACCCSSRRAQEWGASNDAVWCSTASVIGFLLLLRSLERRSTR